MKQQIILKALIGSMVLASPLFSGSLSSTEIVKMVEEIKKERKGIAISQLESTENPFIINIPKKKELPKAETAPLSVVEVVYTLKAILNKAAFIDNKWYKQGDKLGNYKVGYVSSSTVVLKSSNGNRTLSLKKKKRNLIKSNRGIR